MLQRLMDSHAIPACDVSLTASCLSLDVAFDVLFFQK